MIEDRSLTRYFQEVRRHLPCPRKEQDRLIRQAERMVRELEQDNPGLDEGDLPLFLGTPEELAQSFIASLDPETVFQYQRKKRYWKKGMAFLSIFLILILSVFSIYVVHLKSEVEFTQEDTVIINDNPPSTYP